MIFRKEDPVYFKDPNDEHCLVSGLVTDVGKHIIDPYKVSYEGAILEKQTHELFHSLEMAQLVCTLRDLLMPLESLLLADVLFLTRFECAVISAGTINYNYVYLDRIFKDDYYAIFEELRLSEDEHDMIVRSISVELLTYKAMLFCAERLKNKYAPKQS